MSYLREKAKYVMASTPGGLAVKNAISNGIIRHKWVERLRYRRWGIDIQDAASGNRAVDAMIRAGEPSVIAKIGEVELEALYKYFRAKDRGRAARWRGAAERLYAVPAVYPPTAEIFDRFCELFASELAQVDLLGVWHNPGEAEIVRRHCGEASLVDFLSLEPYYFDEPWSRALEGRRVLVASCFVSTIEQQYARRERIWGEKAVLPEFQLVPFRVPFKANIVKPEFESWFDSLREMKGRLEDQSFDVALIGAGPYSIPLAAHAKQMGKVAIHTGGPTQVIFGIKGRRWKYHRIAEFWNDAWDHPLPDETPLPRTAFLANYW